MTVATARAALKTILSGIAGVRAVHDFERYDNESGFFVRHFVRNKAVNGWVIKSTVLPSTELTCSEEERHTRFVIRGWTSATDKTASIKTAETLMETIVNTLGINPTLSGTTTWSDKPEPQPITTGMTNTEPAYLVHQFHLEFTAHTRASITYA